jgi:PhnB protein
MQINPYLSFNGKCAAAFKFYEKLLGGESLLMMTYGESPMAAQTALEHKDHIMHARLKVGDMLLNRHQCGIGFRHPFCTAAIVNRACP